MARVRTSGSLSRAGRPVFGDSEERWSFHQSSTSTYNETKKESRSIAAPSFGESLVQRTIRAPSLLAGVTHQPSEKFPRRSSRGAGRERSPLDDRRRPTGARHRGVPLGPRRSYPRRRSPARYVDRLLPLQAL